MTENISCEEILTIIPLCSQEMVPVFIFEKLMIKNTVTSVTFLKS
jgi:hypothetical protein